MGQEEHDRRIDYVEFGVRDMEATKKFYGALFGWEFTDYGPEYVCTDKVASAGGSITRETFEFPGGRRFHFADPSGNVLAVWSDR